MPQFRFTLHRTLDQTATKVIEAESFEAAVEEHDRLPARSDTDWVDDVIVDGPEITKVEKLDD